MLSEIVAIAGAASVATLLVCGVVAVAYRSLSGRRNRRSLEHKLKYRGTLDKLVAGKGAHDD